MSIYLRAFALCICFYFISNTSYGQFHYAHYRPYSSYSKKGKIGLQRYYIGYGLSSMKVDILQHFYTLPPNPYDPGTRNDPNPPPMYDTTIHLTRKSTQSWSCTGGSFYPLVKSGKNGMFALDVNCTVSLFNYEVGDIKYTPTTYITEHSFSEQASIPFALAFKSGGDVNRNKKDKFMFTFGIGIAPTMSISKVVSPDLQFTARKFLMVEMGYFAGIAWKVRCTYYTGTMTIINTTDQSFEYISSGTIQGNDEMKSTVTGKSCFNISLMCMPFSWHWGESDEEKYDYNYHY